MRNDAWCAAWIAVAMVSMSSAAMAAPERWSITPPATWTDVTEEALRQPEVIEQRKTHVAAKLYVQMRFFTEPASESLLQIMFTATPKGSEPMMRGFEDGARKQMFREGTEVSYRSHRDGDTLVGDQVLDVTGKRAVVRRISGVERGGDMVGVQATCIASLEVCQPILDTLALDRANLQAPPEGANASAYRTGRMLGMVTLIALIGAWLVSYYHRKVKKPA